MKQQNTVRVLVKSFFLGNLIPTRAGVKIPRDGKGLGTRLLVIGLCGRRRRT